MRNTTNYNLKLPDGPDKYNIQDFNSNTEKIDAELKIHSDAIADRYNRTEIDNKFSMHEMNVDWKESVDTFDDIATTYPNPESGWTVNAKDTNYTYRYNGMEWVAISANAIPKATEEIDGIMEKTKVAEINKMNRDMEDVKADLDGLQIGGRNLIANSAPVSIDGWKKTGEWSLSLVNCETAPYGKAIRATGDKGNTGGMFKDLIARSNMINGEKYTISAWIRASKACKLIFDNELMETSNIINVTTSWGYFTFTSKINIENRYSANRIYISSGGEAGMWIEVHSLKLGNGTKITDWNPALKDTDDKIKKLNKDLEDTKGNLSTLEDDVNNYKTTTDNRLSNLEYDSGWQKLAINTLNFSNYNNGPGLLYRSIGKIVNIVGYITTKSIMAGSTVLDNGAEAPLLFPEILLPENIRPANAVVTIHQGSGKAIFMTRVKENGTIEIGRYREGNTYPSTMPSNVWLAINIMYIAK